MKHIQACTYIIMATALTGWLAACGGGGSSSSGGSAEIRHRIFVTGSTYNGNFGGLVEADIVCTNVAAGAGISGSYKAVLSSSSEAANTRLVINGAVYMKSAGSETAVATSGATFWNNMLSNPINVDENETVLLTMQGPWTGTNPGGGTSGIGLTCTDWSVGNNSVLGSTGDTSTTNSALWVNANGFTCDEMRPLYCIEE